MKLLGERRPKAERGFTLIELMTVIVILGLLSTIGIYGFTKYLRRAHRNEIIGDLASLSLRQANFKAVTGHYASTTANEDIVYPTKADITDKPLPIQWKVADAGYTVAAQGDAQYFRGGGAVHGFDALRFVPQGGQSRCGYGAVSGWGTNAEDGEPEEPDAGQALAAAIFPTGSSEAERLYAGDWFYAFAICDFDQDGIYSAFSTQHYDERVQFTSVGSYQEDE